MKKKFKQEDIMYIVIYILFAICVIVAHKNMNVNLSDDPVNRALKADYSWIGWIKYRYESWSSRFIQEAIGYYVLDRPNLWKLLDSLMVISIPWLMSRVSDAKGWYKVIALLLFSLYPISDQASAGWVCTTMTYMWPVFFGFAALALLKELLKNREDKDSKDIKNRVIRVFEFTFSLICLVIASNHELMAVLMLCIILYECIHHYREPKKLVVLLLYILICIVNIVIILRAPGLDTRMVTEVRWLGSFNSFSTIDKFVLGINRCVKIFVFGINPVFILFTMVLFASVLVKTRSLFKNLIASVPLMIVLVLHSMQTQYKVDDITSVNYHDINLRITLLIGFALIVCITLGIIFASDSKNDRYGIREAIVFVVGIATTAVMGFSPTIYASSSRTSTFTYFCVMYVTMRLFINSTDNIELINSRKKVLMLVIGICVIVNMYLAISVVKQIG